MSADNGGANKKKFSCFRVLLLLAIPLALLSAIAIPNFFNISHRRHRPASQGLWASFKQFVFSPFQQNQIDRFAVLNKETQTFAWKFFGHIVETKKENVFWSPALTATSLNMLLLGAKGQTKNEIRKLLNSSLSNEDIASQTGAIHRYFNGLDGSGVSLKTGLSIWMDQSLPLIDTWKNQIQDDIQADVFSVNFKNPEEEFAPKAKEWVAQNTNGLLGDYDPSNLVDSNTNLLGISTAYFKGDWLAPFDSNDTNERDFFSLDGKAIKTEFMNARRSELFFQNKDFKSLRLTYQGGRLETLFILPKNGFFRKPDWGKLEKSVQTALKSEESHELPIALPKFKWQKNLQLIPLLESAGVSNLFSLQASNLQGISNKKLFVRALEQRSFISMDETGTEAAAVETMEMVAAGEEAGVEPPQFIADRPFLFLIRDLQSGLILFMGAYMSPESP